jgi:hypothetical protein
MGTTLDSITLTVLSWTESYPAVAPQWDAWVGSAYKKKVMVLGSIRQITLQCVEQDVTWANSAVKHFQDVQNAGTQITLTSDLVVRPVTSMTVLVLDVEFTSQVVGTQNIRYFSVTLQEV